MESNVDAFILYNASISHLRNDKLVAFQDGSYLMDQEFDGKGLTPYDPAHNSTYLLAGTDNHDNIQTLFCVFYSTIF